MKLGGENEFKIQNPEKGSIIISCNIQPASGLVICSAYLPLVSP